PGCGRCAPLDLLSQFTAGRGQRCRATTLTLTLSLPKGERSGTPRWFPAGLKQAREDRFELFVAEEVDCEAAATAVALDLDAGAEGGAKLLFEGSEVGGGATGPNAWLFR